MPEIQADGCRLFFTVEGPPDAPALLLSNSIGTTSALWDRQAGPFARAFRVVRYDTRGHGRSSVPSGDYTMDQLGGDALAVLDAAGAARAHVCGISLGGITAMWLGVHAPDRIERLVLANTGARVGTFEMWQQRIGAIRANGMAAVAEATPSRWFTEGFRQRAPEVVATFTNMVAACPPDGYAGCGAAIRDTDLREEIQKITAPTLVVTGAADPATPPADGAFIASRILHARRLELEAAHLSNVEAAEAFTAGVLDFLAT
jgi:3-oxoadipate enol-lactonase